jgi:L-lactate dehydrogenase complex protein LldG
MAPFAPGRPAVTGARDAILDAVRAAAAERRARGSAEAAPVGYIRPARASGDPAALLARFRDMALFAGAGVTVVASRSAAPAAISAFLSREALGDRLALSPERWISELPWRDSPRLIARRGAPAPGDRVSVTGVVAAVAETGTLLVRSGPDIANALHLLPEVHIAIVPEGAVVGSYEDALARLRALGDLPRAATFVTGPSRTADIEKTPQIGVHGPRRLHIVVIDGAHA